MERSSKIFTIAVVLILTVGSTGYLLTQNGDGGVDGDHVEDMAGRNVPIPENLDNGIVTVGSNDPLRFVSYFDLNDKVIEVDKGDHDDPKNGRAYSYAYDYDRPDLSWHANDDLSASVVERLGNMKPSLVVIGWNVYTGYKDNVELLSKTVSVFVIQAVPMNKPIWNNDFVLNDDFTLQITKLGKVFREEERASELIDGMNAILSDIRSGVTGSTQNAYVAGLTYMGSNGLENTFPFYAPLQLVGGTNAYGGQSDAVRVTLNVETVVRLDKNIVILDPSSSDKLSENNSQLIMKHMNSENVRFFVIIPIVWDGVNYDCMLASAYYLKHVLYDDSVLTLDGVKEKINGVFEFFYGEDGSDVFDQMSSFFSAKSSNTGQELPLLCEVEILDDGTYRFIAI